MTLKEKLAKIAHPYDLFPDLSEADKARNRRLVVAEFEASVALGRYDHCRNEGLCAECIYQGSTRCREKMNNALAEKIRQLLKELKQDG